MDKREATYDMCRKLDGVLAALDVHREIIDDVDIATKLDIIKHETAHLAVHVNELLRVDNRDDYDLTARLVANTIKTAGLRTSNYYGRQYVEVTHSTLLKHVNSLLTSRDITVVCDIDDLSQCWLPHTMNRMALVNAYHINQIFNTTPTI